MGFRPPNPPLKVDKNRIGQNQRYWVIWPWYELTHKNWPPQRVLGGQSGRGAILAGFNCFLGSYHPLPTWNLSWYFFIGLLNEYLSRLNQERAFFGQFWIDTKKSYFTQMFKPAQNIIVFYYGIFRFHFHHQPIDTHIPQKPLNPADTPPRPPKHIGTLNFNFLSKNRPIKKKFLKIGLLNQMLKPFEILISSWNGWFT